MYFVVLAMITLAVKEKNGFIKPSGDDLGTRCPDGKNRGTRDEGRPEAGSAASDGELGRELRG